MRWLQRFWTALGVSSLALLVVIGVAQRQQPTTDAPRTDSRRAAIETTGALIWRMGRGPLSVWFVLLLILAISAWSAFFPLGPLNPTINLILAAVMLFLLAIFLMDLRNASAVLRLVAVAGLFWVIFLFVLTFTDYLSRRPTLPPQTAPSASTGTTTQ